MYEHLATFKAYCRGAKVDPRGELCLDIVVPKEFKYDALPLTDEGNVLFEMVISKPVFASASPSDLLEGFVFPEGASLGDGSGELDSFGALSESKQLDQGMKFSARIKPSKR